MDNQHGEMAATQLKVRECGLWKSRSRQASQRQSMAKVVYRDPAKLLHAIVSIEDMQTSS